MEQAHQLSIGVSAVSFLLATSVCVHMSCFTWRLLCSYSNTPVDELLGKPYQDEMLALIESFQDTKSKADIEPPDNDEFDEADEAELM